jgi:hypothetical protein
LYKPGEDPDVHALLAADPRGFLENHDAGTRNDPAFLVYGGDRSLTSEGVTIIPWKKSAAAIGA